MSKKWFVIRPGLFACSLLALPACGDPNTTHHAGNTTGGSGGASESSGSGGASSGSGGAAPGSGGASGSGGAMGTGGAPAGTGGDASGSGGAPSGSGGASAPGTGGAPASGSGGAPGSGSGGSGTVSPDMIDNLDDGDDRILMSSGRQGPWHAFNDSSSGNQAPSINGPFKPESGGANGTPYAVHTTGSGYAMFGGVGFDLSNTTSTPEAMQSQGYNASAYTGLSFWAKGNGNLRIEFSQKAFVPTDRGGSCTTNCWNVYGTRSVQGMLTDSWKQFTVMFSSFQREDGTTSPPFDPSALMGIAFKHEGSTFDFWIDEVQFTH